MRGIIYQVIITCLCLSISMGNPVSSYAQDDAVPWVHGEEIEAFGGRYSYDAYACGVIIYNNVAGTQETVLVTGRTAVGAMFRKVLAEDKETAYKLGPALSAEVSVFQGKLRVQLFRSGMMIYERSSRVLWWCWHSQERKVRASISALTIPTQVKPLTKEATNIAML